MADFKADKPAEVAVEAAAAETAPVVEADGKAKTVTTSVWAPGKTAVKEALFNQAIVNTRDAIPVASYDVSCEVKGTKSSTRDKTEGTSWEIAVSYTPRSDVKHEAVDLERVIKEAQASYGEHPGDPDFLEQR